MSERNPPSRPPPPRQQAVRTHSSGSSSSPGKTGFRNPFSSISISYRPTNSRSLDDSDEEIQIVRKTKEAGEQNSDCEENAENCTLLTTQCVDSNQISRPEESDVADSTKPDINRESSVWKRSLSQSKSAHELSLYSSTDSFTSENQNTWPSKNTDVHPPIPMRFLRAKGQSGNDKPELSKSEPSLSTEQEDQADVGSHSSRSHLEVESETKNRERSPSPFRRFLKRENSDSASSIERDKQPDSAISLSSLLASERESGLLNSENEDSWEHIEDESDEDLYVDAVSEPIRKDNFEVTKTKTCHQTVDKTPSSTAFFLCVLLLYIYIISSPTPFISGVVVGSLLMYLIGCAFLWLFCPEDSVSERYVRELNEYKERLRMTPLPEYKSVDPGLLLRPRELKVRGEFSAQMFMFWGGFRYFYLQKKCSFGKGCH